MFGHRSHSRRTMKYKEDKNHMRLLHRRWQGHPSRPCSGILTVSRRHAVHALSATSNGGTILTLEVPQTSTARDRKHIIFMVNDWLPATPGPHTPWLQRTTRFNSPTRWQDRTPEIIVTQSTKGMNRVSKRLDASAFSKHLYQPRARQPPDRG